MLKIIKTDRISLLKYFPIIFRTLYMAPWWDWYHNWQFNGEVTKSLVLDTGSEVWAKLWTLISLVWLSTDWVCRVSPCEPNNWTPPLEVIMMLCGDKLYNRRQMFHGHRWMKYYSSTSPLAITECCELKTDIPWASMNEVLPQHLSYGHYWMLWLSRETDVPWVLVNEVLVQSFSPIPGYNWLEMGTWK
jgi:hypothetical protein